jgi:glycosyltransferase involved in cell wall biosynthesis
VPLFSVIIPTHERAQSLAEAIGSVLAQSVDDWECIVAVDGGTPPDVPADARIRVVTRSVNGGAAAARNTGIDHASGTYVAFLDDDDLWLPERLELALEGLARAAVAVCYGISDGVVGWQGCWEGDCSDTILDTKAPSVDGLAVERSSLVRFDERFRGAEDVEWLLRLAGRAHFATVPRPGFVRANAGTARPDSLLRLNGVKLLLEEHATYFAGHPRAAARCWGYYGAVSLAAGRRSQSRRAFARSFWHRPSRQPLRAWLATWRASTGRTAPATWDQTGVGAAA